MTGVYLLTGIEIGGGAVGLLFAGANALLFAAYITLGHRVSRDEALTSIDGLALSMLIASAAALPTGARDAAPAFTDPILLAAAVGVGVCSSVIPYVCDQLVMRRLARGTYSLMIALLPATATVIGVIVLTQIPSPLEVTGVILVAVHRETRALEPGRNTVISQQPPEVHSGDRLPRGAWQNWHRTGLAWQCWTACPLVKRSPPCASTTTRVPSRRPGSAATSPPRYVVGRPRKPNVFR